MSLRDEYIEMRRSNKFDLVWFYKFYLEEYSKYPTQIFYIVKNEFGTPSFEENENDGEYRIKINESERRELSYKEFAQYFSMILSIYSPSIIEWCDIKLNIQKIEQKITNKFIQNKIVTDELVYLN